MSRHTRTAPNGDTFEYDTAIMAVTAFGDRTVYVPGYECRINGELVPVEDFIERFESAFPELPVLD
jgi:hypothetical protein